MRISGLLVVVAFGVLSLWGVNLSMMNNAHGMMPNCPLSEEMGKVCPMTVNSHISYWQQLLRSVPGKIGEQAVLGILVLVSAFFAAKYLSTATDFAFAIRPGGRAVAEPPGRSFHYLYRNIGSGIVHKRE